MPLPVWTFIEVESIGARPVLDFVSCGVRIFLLNADGVHRLFRFEVDDHPLWM